MAGRSGTSVGVGIAITILGVFCLALFVLTAVFYGKYNKARGELTLYQNDIDQYVKSGEKQDDNVRAIVELAKKSGNKSAVGYLKDNYTFVMQAVSGNSRETSEGLRAKIQQTLGVTDGNPPPLLDAVAERDRRLTALGAQLDAAEAGRKTALADLQNETTRVKTIESDHQKTVDALTKEVGKYKEEVEQYRAGTDSARAKMDTDLAKRSGEFQSREDELLVRINRLTEENLVAQGIIAELRGKALGNILKPKDEYALVDGNVVGLAASNAVISVGARQKVQQGMTFSVYTDASSVKPDKSGEYPPGKATLEVINVGESSSTCRIRNESRGNPVVAGDVIVNPLYDPNKVYTFLLYGNFDSNGDGLATPNERSDVQAIIEGWGGRTVDELGGNLDFLVLGERPALPPKPSADAPVEILQEYIRLSRAIDRYDQLHKQAYATGLPILNENRLYTLLGRGRVRTAGR